MSTIQLACLDMAGTTVADGGAVEAAFTVAIASVGVEAASRRYDQALAYVRATMGRSKREVFGALLGDGTPAGEHQADAATAAFERAYDAVVRGGGLTEVPGAAAAITALRAAGVKVALTTGFSAPTRDAILDALGWHGLVDLAVCPADAGRGRPWPDMILHAVLALRADAVGCVAVCGDTTSDILAGRRAGASVVAGVLTGAHDAEALAAAGATHVLGSVADLPPLLIENGLSTSSYQ
jgi:phosphonatase-like hydrolase